MQNLLDGIWKKGLVWKCKEIFCYWAKVSSEEWWSICFSFVTARAVHFPFEQNIFAGTEAAAVQNYKFPLTFLIFHVFPAQNNMQKFLVKNLFSHSFIQNFNTYFTKWTLWKWWVTCKSLNSTIRSSVRP